MKTKLFTVQDRLKSSRESSSKWYYANRDKKSVLNKRNNAKYRLQVLNHYSKNKLVCDCCGESHLEFLSVDHITGGGKQHRKLTGQGISFYRWIIKNNFPEGLRILCMNCNHSLGHYNYCPHTKDKIKGETKK